MKKAILVVSFGSSHNDTTKKTIEAIEEQIRDEFPEYEFCRAWTSDIIRRILKKRDGVQIHSVDEAMEQLIADQFEEIIVQPTHVINGYENDKMHALVQKYQSDSVKIHLGAPMLTTQEDMEEVTEILSEMCRTIPKEEAVVFMGHGTEHYVNTVYAALDYMLKEKGYENLFIGTVEAYPSVDVVLKKVKEFAPTKVHLMPFMIVAGDHAKNDMAGEEEDSWKSLFEHEGMQVECHCKGLGENESIRKMFVEHVRAAL